MRNKSLWSNKIISKMRFEPLNKATRWVSFRKAQMRLNSKTNNNRIASFSLEFHAWSKTAWSYCTKTEISTWVRAFPSRQKIPRNVTSGLYFPTKFRSLFRNKWCIHRIWLSKLNPSPQETSKNLLDRRPKISNCKPFRGSLSERKWGIISRISPQETQSIMFRRLRRQTEKKKNTKW